MCAAVTGGSYWVIPSQSIPSKWGVPGAAAAERTPSRDAGSRSGTYALSEQVMRPLQLCSHGCACAMELVHAFSCPFDFNPNDQWTAYIHRLPAVIASRVGSRPCKNGVAWLSLIFDFWVSVCIRTSVLSGNNSQIRGVRTPETKIIELQIRLVRCARSLDAVLALAYKSLGSREVCFTHAFRWIQIRGGWRLCHKIYKVLTRVW